MEKHTRDRGIRYGIRTGNTIKKCDCCKSYVQDEIESQCAALVKSKLDSLLDSDSDSELEMNVPAKMVHLFHNTAPPAKKARQAAPKTLRLYKGDLNPRKLKTFGARVVGNPLRRYLACRRSHRGSSLCGRWDKMTQPPKRCHRRGMWKKFSKGMNTVENAIENVMDRGCSLVKEKAKGY